MIEDDFYLSLPDDPDEAFELFEAHVVNSLGEPNPNDTHVEQEYCDYIGAYCFEFEVDLGTPLQQLEGEEFLEFYWRIKSAASFKAKRNSMKRLRRLKGGRFGCYVLLPAQKVEIRHYIEKIRTIIDNVHLTAERRRELTKRLNAFADAVELDRTSIEALHSLYVFAKSEAKEAKDEFKEDVKPIFELVERINSVLAKASEYLGLPEPEDRKKLPKPQKKIEGPKKDTEGNYELDDDIPF